MDSNFTVDPASWRDLKSLRQLEKVCFDMDAWPVWDLLGVLIFPSTVRLKATAEGALIGFISGDIRRWEGIGWITSLGVLPEFRRKGVGTALLQACEERIKLPRLRLCVRKSNQAAISLYQRAGYLQKETWPRYYMGGEDALVMEKIR